jgi:hypothetical protein
MAAMTDAMTELPDAMLSPGTVSRRSLGRLSTTVYLSLAGALAK